MAILKDTIKSWFQTGLKPTQEQFWAWMDSFWHKDEKIPITAIDDIEGILDAKADAEALTNHINAKGDADGYAPLDELAKIAAVYLNIVDDLTTGGATALASAETVKTLKGLIDDGFTLTNIRTLLGIAILSGNNTGDQDLSGLAQSAITVVKVSTNITLDNTYNGKVILLTASANITLPNGLMSGFNYSVKTTAGSILTYTLGSSVTIIENIGLTMVGGLSHTMTMTPTANEFLTIGSL